jgi:hypothetical protein
MKHLTVISSTLLLVLHPVISDPLIWNNGSNQPFNFNPNFNYGQQFSPSRVPTTNVNAGNAQKPAPIQQTPLNNNSQSKQNVQQTPPSNDNQAKPNTQQTPLSNNSQSNPNIQQTPPSNDNQSKPNIQQPSGINNSPNNSTAADYQQLTQFMKQFGVDLGTANSPKLQATTPGSSGDKASDRSNLIESIGSNLVQGYVNQNAQLINKMLTSPDQPFDVQSLFNNPIGGALGVLGPLSGVNTNIPQNRVGPSVQQQVAQKGGSITLYGLVDLVVEWLYNNQGLYSSVLDLLIQLLQLFPFLLDAVFRIIASVNNLFNPTLLNLILKFLYDYQAHSPTNWVKITQLLSVFLSKNYVISAQALRDIIALVGNLPI